MLIPDNWPHLTTHRPVSQVIAHAPFGAARVSPDMRFIAVNSRLATLLRAETHEIEGAEIAEFVPQDDRAHMLESFRSLSNGSEASIEYECQALRRDGTTLWVRWNASASRRSGGTIDYFLVTVHDITIEHGAEVAAATHLAALERLNYLITGFASMVSHETRTALTGIQGMSELMLGGDLKPDEVTEYAGIIFRDAERINRLLSDMLDLNRMQTRRTSLRKELLDLNQVARGAVERARTFSPDKPFTLDLDELLPLVVGDPDRLCQAMENLLHFAARYSSKCGHVGVISRHRCEAVELCVSYDGTQQVVDFDDWLNGRYERYEKNPSSITGVGLGLAIARVIVEQHCGRIWFDNPSGIVCELHVTIPVKGPRAENPTAMRSSQPPSLRSA